MSDLESSPPSQPVLDVLLANHREFLRYVEQRIGDRALAEEILQDAFVRSLDRAEEIRESVIGWFYRVLRNAVVDQQRRLIAAWTPSPRSWARSRSPPSSRPWPAAA